MGAVPTRQGMGRGFVLFVVAIAWLMFGQAEARAAMGVYSAFGSPGSGEGEFASDAPQGIAVAPSGDIYVVDSGNHRVVRMTANGAHASQLGTGSSGALGGQFNTPRGVTIDPTDGSIFVTDGGNLRVQKFSAAGTFIAAFGYNVDNVNPSTGFEVCTVAANCRACVSGTGDGQFGTTFIGNLAIDPDGNLWVADGGQSAGRRMQHFDGETFEFRGKFGGNGSGAGQFGTSSPSRVAVDTDGNIYAVDFANVRVQKCEPSGTPPAVTATCSDFYVAPPGNNAKPVAVAINTGTPSNPGNGHIFIARRNGTGTTTTGEVVIDEYDPSGELIDTHLEGAGVATGVSDTNGRDRIGIAIRTAPSGEVARIYLTNGGGTAATGGPQAFIIADIAAPTATLGEITGVTATEATFHGTVNPQGSPTTYRFEVSLDGGETWIPVSEYESACAGTSPVPVSHTATGLVSGQEYEVRLAASKPYGSPGDISESQPFKTLDAAPLVDTKPAMDIRGARAVLKAVINPNNQATTYRFEYGKTTNYTHVAPSPDASLAADNRPLEIFQEIRSLKPGTTYHFRVVAQNASGVQASADRSFASAPAPAPPPGRAYELVTEGKSGPYNMSPADGVLTGSYIAPDGNAVWHAMSGSTPDAHARPATASAVSRRNPGREAWETNSLTLPGIPTSTTLEQASNVRFTSDDLEKAVISTNKGLTPDAWDGRFSSYLADLRTGDYQLLTPKPLDGSPDYVGTMIGGSADLDQVLVEAHLPLTEEALTLPAGAMLYKWDKGTLELVSVLPDGSPTNGSAGGTTSVANLDEPAGRTVGVLSKDGDVVYFSATSTTNGAVNGGIYRREQDSTTFVNASENTDEVVPPGPATYLIAGRDGSWALFTSTQRLLKEDKNGPCTGTGAAANFGCVDIYMYKHSTYPDADSNLTLLSAPLVPGEESNARGVIGASESGDHVYFVAYGKLTENAPSNSNLKLYLWRSGDASGTGTPDVRYIGDLGSSGVGTTLPWGQGGSQYHLRSVSENGEVMILVSDLQLDPSRDNGGLQQVYRYEVTENKFTCISCPSTGTPSAPARLSSWNGTVPNYRSRGVEPRIGMVDDGSKVTFETVSPLVPGDTNGVQDVYLWDEGEVSLVSTGRSEFNSYVLDISSTGNDIFFTTADRLTSRDRDDARDIYTASVGDVFTDSPSAEPGCSVLADVCQGPPVAPPILSSMESVTRKSAGNVIEPFDLGVQVVRAAAHVDPSTAQITTVSDAIPQILRGVPVRIRDIRVDITRPEFTLNPTNCTEQQVSGRIFGSSGAVTDVSNRFVVDGCKQMGFKPRLTARILDRGRKSTLRSFNPRTRFTVVPRPGDANIGFSRVALPSSTILDQSNLDTTCTRAQMAAENCPAGSVVGHAKAWSPLLDEPLEGRVYLAANGGVRPLPDIVAVLDGQVRVSLLGEVSTLRTGGKARLQNTFRVVPDAPVTRFELTMLGGKNRGLLVNSTDLCRSNERGVAVFRGHNGRAAQQHLRIGLTYRGCAKIRRQAARRAAKRKAARQSAARKAARN